MIGEESPLGAETFHFKFLSGPNSTGGFALSATPEPFGPRNRGHPSELSALNAVVVNTPPASNAINSFIRFEIFCFSRKSEKESTISFHAWRAFSCSLITLLVRLVTQQDVPVAEAPRLGELQGRLPFHAFEHRPALAEN